MRVWASLLGALAAGAMGLAASQVAAADYHVEYRFTGCADGAGASAPLTAIGGLLYGVTAAGGPSNCGDPSQGNGAVFSFNPNTGALNPVYDFQGGADGSDPSGRVVSVGGLLYGTTAGGGVNGGGTVFSLDPTTGVKTILHTFMGPPDGADPIGGLTYAGGKLYGSTFGGGRRSSFCGGCGTLYSIDPTTGAYSRIYAFRGGDKGQNPNGDLLLVKDKLYGVTQRGGANYNHGAIFSYQIQTGNFTKVYDFQLINDGNSPNGGLVFLSGKLYGTTAFGGVGACSCGTVFSFDPSTATESITHAFNHHPGGLLPFGGLVVHDGLLFGTTLAGGLRECSRYYDPGCGVVFSVNPRTGAESVLYAFDGKRDVSHPTSGLTALGRRLFGVTSNVRDIPCNNRCGAIFSVAP